MVTVTVGAKTRPEVPNIATSKTTEVSTETTSEVMDATLDETIAINHEKGTTENERSGEYVEPEEGNPPGEAECSAGADLQEEAILVLGLPRLKLISGRLTRQQKMLQRGPEVPLKF